MNLNEFKISPKAGDYYNAPSRATLQVANAGSGSLVPGIVVKISTMVGEKIGVEAAAVSDVPYGIVVRSLNKVSYAQYDQLGIARAGDIIWMESTAAAIAAGDAVEFTTAGKVLKSAGTNKVIGKALTSVPSAGGLIAIEITAPYSL